MTDLFCGAGGSSCGAAAVAGLHVAFAANHWAAAVDTHAAAHPDTRHVVADLNTARATAYPDAATDILWSSPVCTPYSRANSHQRRRRSATANERQRIDAVDHANRVTPWATLDWIEAHRYRAIIVENVAEIAWRWDAFDAWVTAIMSLGYHQPQLISANSAFHGAHCHRNRLYVTFTRTDQAPPAIDISPAATCGQCGHHGAARQTFRGQRTSGNWGAQYDYRCSRCGHHVTPHWGAASAVIDTTRPWPTIGERTRPLAARSIERLREGHRRFGPGAQWVVGYFNPGTWRPLDAPLGTITCRDHHFVVTNPDDLEHRDAIDNTRLRYLHVDELAAAMGFAPEHPWPERASDARTMIGNAVTPPVATRLLTALTRHLDGDIERSGEPRPLTPASRR
jgi:DNA (cytosine-5)-methyltransferase 1